MILSAAAVLYITLMTALPVTIIALLFVLRGGHHRDANLFFFFVFLTLYDAVVPSLESVYIAVTGQAIGVPIEVVAFFMLLQFMFLTAAVAFMVKLRRPMG